MRIAIDDTKLQNGFMACAWTICYSYGTIFGGLESIVFSLFFFSFAFELFFIYAKLPSRAFIRPCFDMQRMNVSDEFFIVATSRVAFSILYFDALCFIMATDRESAEIRRHIRCHYEAFEIFSHMRNATALFAFLFLAYLYCVTFFFLRFCLA